jgi:hypothetical protein
MMKRFALACILATACGGKAAPVSPTASAPVPDCKTVADKLANDTSLHDKAALATALEARCKSDAWNDEARTCLATKGEAGPCVLTDQQRAGIEQDRAKVVQQDLEKSPPTDK